MCCLNFKIYCNSFNRKHLYQVQDPKTPEQMPNFVTEKMRAQKE